MTMRAADAGIRAPARHRAGRERLDHFADEVLVACPACARRAIVRHVAVEPPARAAALRATHEARLTCLHCGHNARRAAFLRWVHAPCDPVLALPVWLQAPCAGHVLWAYNLRHLEAIEAFVAATHRERRRDDAHGWRNAAWTSRLPRWLSAAKHRGTVLHAIARLRARADD